MRRIALLSFFFCFLASPIAKADHLMGGEITWRCNSSGNYIFTLTLYGDCNGALSLFGQTTTIQSNSSAGAITVNKISEVDVSPDCYDATQAITCQKAINSTTYVDGAVKKYVYESAPQALNGIPPVAGWTFSWTSCCRPNGLQNAPNPGSLGYYLRTKMYSYAPPGQTPLNTSTCYDNSPLFAENGSPTICSGYKFTYNHLAADRDLDSLSFKWDVPQVSSTTAMTWVSGYSNTQPFPDASEDASNGPISLDPVSGEMLMEVNSFGSSSAQGQFASCIKIEAWRDCQLIAEVYRDVALTILGGCAVNGVPDAAIDTSIYSDINRIGSTYRTSIFPGDTLKFELFAQDFDFLPNGQPQTITFEAGGLQVSSPLSSGTGCLGAGTCAKFTPVSPQTGFTQGLQNTVRFEWSPDCNHLGTLLNGCGGVTSTYYFTLKMRDNACPAPAVSISTLIVDVIPGDPNPPDLSCVFQNENGDIDISWNESEIDSSLQFNFYSILGSANANGPYDTLGKVYNRKTITTSLSPAGSYNYFYMVKSTGICDFFSVPSDTFHLMGLSMTTFPPAPNSEYADLSWTPFHDPLPSSSSGVYEIWNRVGANGIWNKVGETDSTFYRDTVNVCDEIVYFQIRVLDTIHNCYSGSNIQNARFSDQSNGDVFTIDSISINGNGQAELAWSGSPSPDAIGYYLIFNHPTFGWTTIDTLPINVNQPYSWAGSLADTRPEQYKILSFDSCQNPSSSSVSVSHTSMLLGSGINACDAEATLRWSPYEGFHNGLSTYHLYVRVDDGTGFGAPVLLFTGDDEDSVYIHKNLQVNYEYCYFVRAWNGDSTVSARSNEICIIGNVPQASRILYLASVSNNYLRSSIDLVAFVDGEADVDRFEVERAIEPNGIYEVIGTVAKPISLPYTISFSDYSADPNRIYFYRLKSHNSCGGIDSLSNRGNNISLNIKANANFSNALNWNAYRIWGGGVGRYDIYRSIGDNFNFEFIGSNSGDDTTYIDELEGPGLENAKACYYVQAVEDNNPLGLVDQNGQPFSSLSNRVCAKQKVRVYIPTAFRPNSDIEANRSFGPSMRFEDIQDYNFYILNRWGTVVFQTSDPVEFWDGKIDGKEAPIGVYNYHLKFSSLEDVNQEERGTFTLIY